MVTGLALYLFDYGSDIYVAYRFWENEDIWWLSVTALIIVSSIIVNVTAMRHPSNDFTRFAGVHQLSIVSHYIAEIRSQKKFEKHSLEILRYIQTITQSAPQCCLQCYVMLRQWDCPSYIIVSLAFSFVSLTWSIISLEKARREEIKKDFAIKSRFFFFMWQLCTLIPRLCVIVLFIYVFRYYVLIFFVIHGLLHVAVIFTRDRRKRHHVMKSSLLTSYPSLFHASETILGEQNPEEEMTIGYIIIVLETIIMVILSVTIEMPGVAHMDILKPIAFGLMAVGLLSTVFCYIYYEFDDDGNIRRGMHS